MSGHHPNQKNLFMDTFKEEEKTSRIRETLYLLMFADNSTDTKKRKKNGREETRRKKFNVKRYNFYEET